jgi:hypothetical protein
VTLSEELQEAATDSSGEKFELYRSRKNKGLYTYRNHTIEVVKQVAPRRGPPTWYIGPRARPIHTVYSLKDAMDWIDARKAEQSKPVQEAKGVQDFDFESHLSDPKWAAREYGVADISGSTARERAEDLLYQLGYESGRTGRDLTSAKSLLAWVKKSGWKDAARSYESGLTDGKESLR